MFFSNKLYLLGAKVNVLAFVTTCLNQTLSLKFKLPPLIGACIKTGSLKLLEEVASARLN
jgi:hypothetical protein